MFDGEAEDEISKLFKMKDHEWPLCTGDFKVGGGRGGEGGEGVCTRRTVPDPTFLIARRGPTPKNKKSKIEKKSF